MDSSYALLTVTDSHLHPLQYDDKVTLETISPKDKRKDVFEKLTWGLTMRQKYNVYDKYTLNNPKPVDSLILLCRLCMICLFLIICSGCDAYRG